MFVCTNLQVRETRKEDGDRDGAANQRLDDVTQPAAGDAGGQLPDHGDHTGELGDSLSRSLSLLLSFSLSLSLSLFFFALALSVYVSLFLSLCLRTQTNSSPNKIVFLVHPR